MKSIIEKAEEWADMYPSCGMADKSFTKGANYVLEEVKILLNSQRFVDNPSQELFELIKQLKK